MMDERDAIPSHVKVKGHPIHPMLIPFPLAFLTGALVTDLIYWGSGDAFWARMSYWLLAAGLASGVLAALAGLGDFLSEPRIRALRHAWEHFLGNAVALVLAAVNLGLRAAADPAEAVLPWGLVLSALIALILGFTGWLGGELVYRHKVGMTGPTRGGRDRA